VRFDLLFVILKKYAQQNRKGRPSKKKMKKGRPRDKSEIQMNRKLKLKIKK